MVRYNYQKLLGKIRENGLTQAQLATKIGLSETTLNLTLNNKRSFKQNEITQSCRVLGIKPLEIEQYFFCSDTLEKLN